jgi:hypothetical protein
MRTLVLAALLTSVIHGACAADQAPPHAARPDEEAIRKAIRETLDEKPDNPRLHEADTLRANRYDIFARRVDEATVPDCLHADGLKRQPTGIGPIQFSGLLALPFVAVAKVRGKCQ